MFLRVFLVVGCVCAVCFGWDWKEEDKLGCRTMTEAEMRETVGGHGGASCDSCQNSNERMDECAHFTSGDPCRTHQCIENWLVEDSCQLSEQSDCWSELDGSLNYMVQYLRTDTNCATENPSEWQVWRIHYYGPSCKTRTYNKRCQKGANSCGGNLLATSESKGAIRCI